jgi:hypothetical protein
MAKKHPRYVPQFRRQMIDRSSGVGAVTSKAVESSAATLRPRWPICSAGRCR